MIFKDKINFLSFLFLDLELMRVEKRGYVYFISNSNHAGIKIGFSQNPQKRDIREQKRLGLIK